MKRPLKLLLWVLILAISISLVIVFSSGGCRPAVSAGEEPEEETATVEEPVEEETVLEEVIDINKVKFWEAIVEGDKSYDITDKVLNYPMEEINILTDFIDGKIDFEEQISRFWDLANKVKKDFLLSELIIQGRLKEKGITPNVEMTNIINMITEWADKIGNSYSYYAKYLDTEQAEYDFKVDELKEEADSIHQEYLILRYPFIKEYNTYYGIE